MRRAQKISLSIEGEEYFLFPPFENVVEEVTSKLEYWVRQLWPALWKLKNIFDLDLCLPQQYMTQYPRPYNIVSRSIKLDYWQFSVLMLIENLITYTKHWRSNLLYLMLLHLKLYHLKLFYLKLFNLKLFCYELFQLKLFYSKLYHSPFRTFM